MLVLVLLVLLLGRTTTADAHPQPFGAPISSMALVASCCSMAYASDRRKSRKATPPPGERARVSLLLFLHFLVVVAAATCRPRHTHLCCPSIRCTSSSPSSSTRMSGPSFGSCSRCCSQQLRRLRLLPAPPLLLLVAVVAAVEERGVADLCFAKWGRWSPAARQFSCVRPMSRGCSSSSAPPAWRT